jgi:arylsulfatase A-like enzyme
MRRAVIVVLDGLRRDFVTGATTPRLHEFAQQAERFAAHRSVFPSATRVVSSSLATGCYPNRHGMQGNSFALMEAGTLVAHDAGLPDFLQHKRRVTGSSLAMPTLAQRLAPHGGAWIFSNVSPGAAYTHDPDGWGHVYHRAGSFGPGRVSVADPLLVTLDAAGDRAMTERFVAEVLPRRAPLSILWLGEPDHIQHEVGVGHPEMLRVLAEADRNAGLVMDALAGDEEALLIVASDHGHETVVGVVDVDAALVAAGLKAAEDSNDVVTVSNGTSCLIYLHPDHAARLEALGRFLAAQDWAGHVLAGDGLAAVGQSHANALAFAVAMRCTDAPNEFGARGSALVAKPRGGKPDRLGCGQHGGLGQYEQMPFLLVAGPGFTPRSVCHFGTSVVDLAPTVLTHLGLPAHGMDGHSLQHALS